MRAIVSTYEGFECAVIADGCEASDWFKIKSGVKQECVMSVFCHACHASSVTTQFSIVARYHDIDFPCDLGIVIVLSCSLVKTLSRFTAKIYFE